MNNAFRIALAVLFLTVTLCSVASECSETVTIPADPDPNEYAVMHISMFGAVPDNLCSDHFAFEAAAEWFNARGGNGELQFDDGLYIVGHQDPGVPPSFYQLGRSPLNFKDCVELSLVGGEATRFKYEDCLYFGAFDHITGDALLYPCGLSCAEVVDMATIGVCILLERCSYVAVSNLTLDGNMNNIWIGGATSADGTQLQHTGIVLDDSWEVTLQDVNVYQFCLDGMYILAKELSVFEQGADMRIGIHGCAFSRNGRNGLSWMGGAGVNVTGCRFELNGTYLVRSKPGAGVDIEYHGFVTAFDSAPIGNGSFSVCTFKYNKGFGVISDVGEDYLPYVPGPFRFFSCKFIGSEGGVALWPNAPEMRFDYCRIHGRTVVPFDCQLSGDLEDRTQFYLCDFDETYYDEEDDVRYSMSWHDWEGYDHLVQADRNGGHGGVTFELCTFRTYCRLMPFSIHGGEAVTGLPNYHAMMLDCIYIYEGAHIEPTDPPAGEYSANFAQFAENEVDLFRVIYPSDYNLSLLLGVDFQIHQAYDHAFTPAEVFANSGSNLILEPHPPSFFPFYGICPEPYVDPVAAYYMCTECPDGCECALHIPPPENGPFCPPEKAMGRPIAYPKRTLLREHETGLNTNTGVDEAPVQWIVQDALGRHFGVFATYQESDAALSGLTNGVYFLTKVVRATGNVLEQVAIFKP